MKREIILFFALTVCFIHYMLAQDSKESYPTSASKIIDKNFIKSESKRLRAFEIDKTKDKIEFYNGVNVKQPIILQEGFEGSTFPPQGWSSVVVNGEPDWTKDFLMPYSGTACAYSSFGPAGILSSRYLITKRIPVVGTYEYRLSFWIKREFIDVYDPDTVYVKLSNTDSLASSFTTTLYKCYTGTISDTLVDPNIYTPNYRKFTVSFSGYSGFVWIAFDHQDNDGQGIFLDDIRIEQIVDNDIQPELITEPFANSRKNYNQSFAPKAKFKNSGLVTQNNIPVSFQIISPFQTIIYNNTKTISSLAPDSTKEVVFDNFMPYIYGIHKARAISKNPADQNQSNDTIDIEFKVPLNLSGTRTIGVGGDHSTILNAIEFIKDNNISDTLTFLLINNEYDEVPIEISNLYYTSTLKPVIIKPASGLNPRITINATILKPYGIKFSGVKNFIIDGSNGVSEKNRSLTINLDTLGFFAPAILIADGCANLEMKNFNIYGYSKSDLLANTCIIVDSLGNDKASLQLSFKNLNIMRAFNGFFFNGSYSSKHSKIFIEECIIGGENVNKITQAGIVFYRCDSITINRNNIQNLLRETENINLYGIYIGHGTKYSIISNNLIHRIINNSNGNYTVGIQNNSGLNSNLLCYNNMIYDIGSFGVGNNQNKTFGIYSSNELNSDENYYYNSIYLYGTDSSLSSNSFSTGFYFISEASNIIIKNNSVYNIMNFISTTGFNKAYGIYILGVNWPNNSTSNYNNLYTPGSQGAVGFINSVNRYILNEWKTYTNQDLNSISSDPLYKSNNDLHIQNLGIRSPLDSAGTPITGINYDFDNEMRNSIYPDIGADEFTIQVGIEGQVKAGWNMISIPVLTDDNRVRSIFPNAISNAFMFNNGYIQSDTLKHGIGYWLKFPSNQNVFVGGTSIVDDTINVTNGWNLIGTISTPITQFEVKTIPENIISSNFYGFNNGYVKVDTLFPLNAYWIKVNQSGKLILKK